MGNCGFHRLCNGERIEKENVEGGHFFLDLEHYFGIVSPSKELLSRVSINFREGGG